MCVLGGKVEKPLSVEVLDGTWSTSIDKKNGRAGGFTMEKKCLWVFRYCCVFDTVP